VRDQNVLDTDGREVTRTGFGASFPSQAEAALERARGVVQGIDAVSGDGGANGELLDGESLRAYHDIYRLRIELELETAGVLWRAAEAAWALLDVADALTNKVDGGEAAALRDSLVDRRSNIVLPRPPFANGANGGADGANVGADGPDGNGRRRWIPFRRS
jgi:hypothetical protein